MEEQIVYSDLRFPQSDPAGSSQQVSKAKDGGQVSSSFSPYWRPFALCLTLVSVVLLATMIAFSVKFHQVSFLQQQAEKEYQDKLNEMNKLMIRKDTVVKKTKGLINCKKSQDNTETYQCCETKWHLFDGKCFYFSDVGNYWESSNQSCSSQGAQLAVIKDQKTMDFLQKKLEQNRDYWIGLKKRGSDWIWVDGTTLNKQFHVSRYNGDCITVCSSGNLYSYYCLRTYQWICMKNSIEI
ncbi:C-type lectin domain family 2 member L-like [Latimeria chalumnae]|uniref:C-type lectin domain family 2 member L-like n=1 Tax=Latimeria chalumnae TaxID=7897 RepID=UPI0003C0FCCF|nr:PREDICTED: C-type lectin domain family 2 member L-like [Latimeria chalumnae]|eukprot:XP_006011100.1 PREDICTED: C-type lectin domain family 2 member L-like [Latimeria chalumnae]